MSIRFDGRVAIVTGAGAGLGRAHALGLAARGAQVLVNDLGTAGDGQGRSSAAAEAVVAEIVANGGEALASGANVADRAEVDAMVDAVLSAWGRVDILVNNAGILRDKTFAKLDLSDFDAVMAVHVGGSVNCTHRLWPVFLEQGYGRVVFTSSASGLYGNFGQSNYGAAKAAMLGLMNVLHLEGQRDNIRVNTLAPTAATRMTESLLPAEALPLLQPETITPGLLYLVSEAAPSRIVLAAGAGCYAQTVVTETDGILLPAADNTPENVAARFGEICDTAVSHDLQSAFDQTRR
ncbi:MAG: SDR family NAD(P)-dependent oxidoreductase, partial [Pseudomonadota bacterium]